MKNYVGLYLPTNIAEFKTALLTIRCDLLQE